MVRRPQDQRTPTPNFPVQSVPGLNQDRTWIKDGQGAGNSDSKRCAPAVGCPARPLRSGCNQDPWGGGLIPLNKASSAGLPGTRAPAPPSGGNTSKISLRAASAACFWPQCVSLRWVSQTLPPQALRLSLCVLVLTCLHFLRRSINSKGTPCS